MIRLSRRGAKKQPHYIIVAVDKANRRDGEYLEKLGQYFPKAKEHKDKVKINMTALAAWQKKGALLSETVGQLLKKQAK